MKKITKFLLTGLGFGLLAVVLSVFTSKAAPAQAQRPSVPSNPAIPALSLPVTVVNTTSQPVPTAAQGTTTVAGSVAISGTPNVNANISNTASTPLFTRDVDNPARSPFQALLCFTSSTNASGFDLPSCNGVPETVTVPTGRRLVVEFVSGNCVTQGTGINHIHVGLSSDGIEYPFPLFAGLGEFDFAQQTRIYAGTGVGFSNEVGASGPETIICFESVSGYTIAP